METPPDIAMISIELMDIVFRLAMPEGSTKDHPITNPMGPFAPNLQNMNLPQFLVAIAGHDLMRDMQFEYCEAMNIAGKSVEVFKTENAGHCFHLDTTDTKVTEKTQELLDAIHSFIKTCCQKEISK